MPHQVIENYIAACKSARIGNAAVDQGSGPRADRADMATRIDRLSCRLAKAAYGWLDSRSNETQVKLRLVDLAVMQRRSLPLRSIASGDPRCRKNFPHRHEHRCNQPPDDKTIEAEDCHAAKGGNQHDIVR